MLVTIFYLAREIADNDGLLCLPATRHTNINISNWRKIRTENLAFYKSRKFTDISFGKRKIRDYKGEKMNE